MNGSKNGKGKEFYWNTGQLRFEGQYLNELRNGNGNEYYNNGKLKFEGEYLYGKRWNGKGYDIENNIIYEIKDGKGLIKEYNDWGKLIFEGEYLNGKRNGKGKEYFYGELDFEGEYLNGKKMEKEKNMNLMIL